MDDNERTLEELRIRLAQKDTVIDALRHEISSLKQKIRGFEEALGQDGSAASRSRMESGTAGVDPSNDLEEQPPGAIEEPAGLDDVFELTEDRVMSEASKTEAMGRLLTDEEPRESSAPDEGMGATEDGESETGGGFASSDDGWTLEEGLGGTRKRNLAPWLIVPLLVVILSLAARYAFLELSRRSANDTAPAAGTDGSVELETTAGIAAVLSEAERFFSHADYEACRRIIEESKLDLGTSGKELLAACTIVPDPARILTTSPDASWVRALAGILASRDAAWRVRQIAARRLGDMQDQRSLDALAVSLINDPDWAVRCEAADSLGRLGDIAALASLEKSRTSDEENIVRITAEQAIAQLRAAAAGRKPS